MHYLTATFCDGFKDKAKIEPVKVDYKGKKIDAYRITMAPYVGDATPAKMQGCEGAKFTMIVSDQVPGEIVDLIVHLSRATIKAARSSSRSASRWTERSREMTSTHNACVMAAAGGCRRWLRGGDRRRRAARQRLSDLSARRLRVRLHADERADARRRSTSARARSTPSRRCCPTRSTRRPRRSCRCARRAARTSPCSISYAPLLGEGEEPEARPGRSGASLLLTTELRCV